MARERESWALERESLREALRDSRETLLYERGVLERERELFERERSQLSAAHEDALAQSRRELDVALGHVSVRSVLEEIAMSFEPRRPTTQALQDFCKQGGFEEYLGVVSRLTHISVAELASSAKGAYAHLSATVHHGSTLPGAAGGVPHEVMSDRARLYGVAAIFKYAGRDVRFYMQNSRDVLRLPSPPRSPPPSVASSVASASTSPAAQPAQPAPALTPGEAALSGAGGSDVSASAVTLPASAFSPGGVSGALS